MIKINSLSKIYAETKIAALKNISFCLPNTGLYFLTGPSGSGKTTLIDLIAAIDCEYQGSIKVDHLEIKNFSALDRLRYYRQTISAALQNDEVDGDMSVLDNVLMGLLGSNQCASYQRRHAHDLLRQLGLDHLESKKTNTLSGGEKRRVGVARALIKSASIYILDEPLNGLDCRNREIVNEIITQKSEHSLVLIVSHHEQEIPQEAGEIRLSEGCLKSFRVASPLCRLRQSVPSFKNKARAGALFCEAWGKLMVHKARYFFAEAATAISFSCFGISLLLATSVSQNLQQSLAGAIDPATILIQKREQNFLEDEIKNVSEEVIADIFNKHTGHLISYGTKYSGNVEEMFPSQNDVSLIKDNRSIKLNTLSFRSFLNVAAPVDLEENINFAFEGDLSNDEIYLGLPAGTIEQLEKEFFDFSGATLLLKLANAAWSYQAEVLLTIRSIFVCPVALLVHPSDEFVVDLVTRELKLKVSDNLETTDLYPWTLKRNFFLRIKEEERRMFLESFSRSSWFKEVSLKRLNYDYLATAAVLKNNKLLVTSRKIENYDLNFVEALKKELKEVKKIDYSTELLTYQGHGFATGFNTPFFVAKDRSKINLVIDSTSGLEEAIGLVPPPGVMSADIYRSLGEKSVKVMSAATDRIIEGVQPQNCREITVSTGLLSSLAVTSALGSFLHYGFFNPVTNRYVDDRWVITAVAASDLPYIVIDPVSLLELSLFYLDCEIGQNITGVAFHLKNESELSTVKKSLQIRYPDMIFTAPGLALRREIGDSLKPIVIFLFSFSVFSLTVSAFLLGFVLYLNVIGDRRRIGVKMLFGWSLARVKTYYFFQAAIIAGGGLLSSWAAMAVAQTVFSKTMASLPFLARLPVTFWPQLAVAIIGVTVAVFSTGAAVSNLRNKTPRYFLRLTPNRF